MTTRRTASPAVLVLFLVSCGGAGSPSTTSVIQPATSAGDSTAPTASASAETRCPNPDGGASNTCLGDLAAGTYRTATFTPQIAYTVPAGWSNQEDLPGNFLLLPPGATLAGVDAGTSDYLGIYSSATVPSGCDGRADPDIQRTPEAMAAWLQDRAGVVATEAVPAEVGGLSGVTLDISFDPSATEMCEAPDFPQPFVDILVGLEPTHIVHSIAEGFSYRLYLLENENDVLVIELQEAEGGGSDFEDEWFEGAAVVVESLSFVR